MVLSLWMSSRGWMFGPAKSRLGDVAAMIPAFCSRDTLRPLVAFPAD